MSQRPDLSAEDWARDFVEKLRAEDDRSAVAALIELIRSIEELTEPAYIGGDPIDGSPNKTGEDAVFGHRLHVGTGPTKGFRQQEDGDITIDGTTVRIDAGTGAVTIVTDDLVVKDSGNTNRVRVRDSTSVEIFSDEFQVHDADGNEIFSCEDVSGTNRIYMRNIQSQSTNGTGLRFLVINNTSGELRKWTGGGNTPGSQ